MTWKKTKVCLMAALLLTATLFSGVTSVYAATGETEYTDRAYQSVLEISGSGEAKESYVKGETLTLELAVSPKDGQTFGIRDFGAVLTYDTKQFTLVTAAGISGKTTINTDYKPDSTATAKKILMTYWNENAVAQSESLVIGTVTLKVADSVSSGTAEITQNVEGIADMEGRWATDVTAVPLSVTLDDGRLDYRFGLEVVEGVKASYHAGDQFTVRSVVTSSALSFDADVATNRVQFDSSVFELVSRQAGTGVEISEPITSGGNTSVKMVYTNPGGATAQRLELGTFTLKVKDTADTGASTITQTESALTADNAPSSRITANKLDISIIKVGSAIFELTPRSGMESCAPGETVTLDLAVKAAGSFSPRLIGSEIAYNKEVFEFVTASALSEKTTVGERSPGMTKWLYYDAAAPAATDVITLGSMTLRVKSDAPKGTAVISQQDANLITFDGTAETAYEDITYPDVEITVEEKTTGGGVTVSGTMSFGAGKVAQIDALTGAEGLVINAAANGTTAGDYTLNVTSGSDTESSQKYVTFGVTKTGESKAAVSVTLYDASAEQTAVLDGVSLTLKAASLNAQAYQFTLEGVSAGSYKVVTYKKNHTTAVTNGVTAVDADIVLGQDMGMFAGDVDGNDEVNINDYSLLTAQYNKTGQEELDMDDNDEVNINDYSLQTANYNKQANVYNR